MKLGEKEILTLALETQAHVVKMLRDRARIVGDEHPREAQRLRFMAKSVEEYTIKVSKRLTRAAGRCNYGTKTITISLPIFSREENAGDCRETILHEIAHAMTPGDHHGPEWREAAHMIGSNGSRTHSLNTDGLGRRVEIEARCQKCGFIYKIGAIVAKRMNAGGCYRHRRCGGRVEIKNNRRDRFATAANAETKEVTKSETKFRANAYSKLDKGNRHG